MPYSGQRQAFEAFEVTLTPFAAGLSQIVAENLFDKIHADARWLPFLRKIGKAPEQLAKIEFRVTLPQSAETAAGAGERTKAVSAPGGSP